MSLPNIILIITDQQRADTIAALGADWMHTPHLDRLAREGTAFTKCFVTSPVCVASRASLFTGKYPHSTHVFTNFEPWEPTWVKSLAAQGYHCASIGKMHINPYDAAGGFHQRFVVENKDRPLFLEERDRAFYDEWDKALHVRGLTKPSRFNRYASDPEGYKSALGAFAWHLDADMHPDNFVGNTACWWIEDRKCADPLFLQIGFPGPHPPYDPLPEWLDRYAEADIPVPEVSDAELQRQPRAQKMLRENMTRLNFDSVNWRTDATREDLLRLRRHYAANVSMIDMQVGRIMAALDARGYLDNAIVIFTSDHADALGDHGHIQKWTMYDSVLHVPLMIWSKGRIPGGRVNDDLVQLIDIAPTILEAADLPFPLTSRPVRFGEPLRDVQDMCREMRSIRRSPAITYRPARSSSSCGVAATGSSSSISTMRKAKSTIFGAILERATIFGMNPTSVIGETSWLLRPCDGLSAAP